MRRKGRQQIDQVSVFDAARSATVALLALQQHLVDARGTAEVAVDLERRVRVEHVAVGAATLAVVISAHAARDAKLLIQDLERVISITKSRIKIDLPRVAPPRGLIATQGK